MGNTGTIVPSDLQFQSLSHILALCAHTYAPVTVNITDKDVCNRLYRYVTQCVIILCHHAEVG